MKAKLFAFFLLISWGADLAAANAACPDELEKAERLALVVAPSVDGHLAQTTYFRRDENRKWKAEGTPHQAVIGRSGLAWSWAFDKYAKAGEPVKKEGDGYTPAGFYWLGKPFGTKPTGTSDYTRLRAGQHFCVDDVRSRKYNAILPKSSAGRKISGEDMGRISLYRQGLFVEYPTNRERKGGSCIFVHVWRSATRPTAGCVAMEEKHVIEMQHWASQGPGKGLLAILPRNALSRFKDCLPKEAN